MQILWSVSAILCPNRQKAQPPVSLFSLADISKKKQLHLDAPSTRYASGGPGAEKINLRPLCEVFTGC